MYRYLYYLVLSVEQKLNQIQTSIRNANGGKNRIIFLNNNIIVDLPWTSEKT